MIHYQLRCGRDHAFDGWFSDSAGFDRQAARGLVECPVCADTRIERALMAPALAGARRQERRPEAPSTPEPSPPAAPDAPAMAVTAPRMPDHVRAMLQRMRAQVERNCDYVGPGFAEEARRMHRGESDRRGIYGETTPEQAEALDEEGIEVGRIPWVPRADG